MTGQKKGQTQGRAVCIQWLKAAQKINGSESVISGRRGCRVKQSETKTKKKKVIASCSRKKRRQTLSGCNQEPAWSCFSHPSTEKQALSFSLWFYMRRHIKVHWENSAVSLPGRIHPIIASTPHPTPPHRIQPPQPAQILVRSALSR